MADTRFKNKGKRAGGKKRRSDAPPHKIDWVKVKHGAPKIKQSTLTRYPV